MKSICITGAIQQDLQIVANILNQAGMQIAKPARRDEAIDMAYWHEQVLAVASEGAEEHLPIENPGRLWEQLAGDLFLANGKAKVWGWAEVRSTWLLNYWSAFDPQVNFLLVCVSPRYMLASAMAAGAGEISVDAVMQAWQGYHRELLRFYHRNSQRCLLVDAEDCLSHPQALIELCAGRWKLPIRADEALNKVESSDSLALYLAEQICSGYPELAGLHNEIRATIVRLGDVSDSEEVNALTPECIIGAYHRLRDVGPELTTERATLVDLAENNTSLRADIDLLKAELTVATEELARCRDEQQTASATHAAENSLLETRLREATQESELLLVQLHQVQEELEQSFLKAQDAIKQADTLTLARDETAQKLAVAGKLADERQAQAQKLTQERDNYARQSAERQQQVENLTQANAALIRESADLTARYDAVQKEVAAFTVTRDELTALKIRFDQTSDTLAKEKDQLNQKLKASEQEGELILLQLHQVQEELENYFLKYQECQELLQAADARWQRVFERNPAYCDFESIEVLPGDPLTWRIRNLSAAGRNLPEIEFRVIMEHNIAGFVFRRQPNTTGPLIRWPVIAADRDELVLIPVGDGTDAVQRIEALQDIAASDWDLLKLLNRIVTATLANPGALVLPEKLEIEALKTALANLARFIEKARGIFSYDRVSLKREQADPNIEYLWLRFDNLGYGGKRWPEFEFRLACVMVEAKRFGTHPRLEFPEACAQAFDAWFVESSGDYGDKLELRFALPDAMDLGVWQRISDNDRDFISTLIKRLPFILDTLRLNGVKPKRTWEDWIKVVRDMQHIATLRNAPAPAIPSVAAIRVPSPSKQTQSASLTGAKVKKPQTAAPASNRKKVSTK